MNTRLKNNIDPFFYYYNSNLISNYHLFEHIIKTFDTSKYFKELKEIEKTVRQSGNIQDHQMKKIETHLKYLRLPNLVANMIIVGLISHFEYFVKSCLVLFLYEEPRSLKNDKKITFAEVIDLPDYNKIIALMIDKEMDDLFCGNIEKIILIY